MRFEEALIELRKGKKIVCVSREGMRLHISDYDELSVITKPNFTSFECMELIVKGEWFIEEEPGKTFPEVFEAFKEGKKIKRKVWEEIYFHIDKDIFFECITPRDLIEDDWEIIE
jgi:hypothetical protein